MSTSPAHPTTDQQDCTQRTSFSDLATTVVMLVLYLAIVGGWIRP